ncbi:hypothetical protein [Pandoraea norimbergensis]|uniref:Uncharacterized protein n=1 Tax=Pandoraea norimbergensis TaxID=93219 RepID=A0ABN4JLS1_9BURK|nr:hypothetical protein [Pandoraea norimbergensis]ALS60684.1 hypothetical protein AT302_13790 [Pandoraea norimbergensis]ALS61975.1 hypothetical protein AT302_21515 [Pandoraea norimbergensis]
MSFLAGLFGVLSFLFLVVTLVGVIAPSLFKDKKSGEVPKRLHFLVGGVAGSVIAFVIAGALAPEKSPDSTSIASAEHVVADAKAIPSAVTTSKDVPQTPDKSLGMSPEEFRQGFNRIVSKVSSDYKMAELDIESGNVNDVFKRSLGPGVALIGTVNKADGSLRELMVLIGGGANTDPAKTIAVLMAATQAANPTISAKENSSEVVEMTKVAVDNIKTGKPVERQVGRLAYTASASEATGLMFAIGAL